jgi:hypothetical protein
MNAPPPRTFFLPLIGLTLLFAVFGPAIGGAVFIPLAFLLEAPAAAEATLHLGWIATLIGHALALIPAYLLGFGPALATGFVYALWDAWASTRSPRALAAAVMGGALTYGQFVWLAHIGAALEQSIDFNFSAWGGSGFEDFFSGEFDAALQQALVASGAVAGFACALAASLLGLTTAPVSAESSQK